MRRTGFQRRQLVVIILEPFIAFPEHFVIGIFWPPTHGQQVGNFKVKWLVICQIMPWGKRAYPKHVRQLERLDCEAGRQRFYLRRTLGIGYYVFEGFAYSTETVSAHVVNARLAQIEC